jgi:ABC-type molybdate transport system permease subunit
MESEAMVFWVCFFAFLYVVQRMSSAIRTIGTGLEAIAKQLEAARTQRKN